MRILHAISLFMLVSITSAHAMLRQSGRVEGLRRFAESAARRSQGLGRLPDARYKAPWAERAKLRYLTGEYNADDVSCGSVSQDEARVIVQFASDIEKEGLGRVRELEPLLFGNARKIVTIEKALAVGSGVLFVGFSEALFIGISYAMADGQLSVIGFAPFLTVWTGCLMKCCVPEFEQYFKACHKAKAIENGGSQELISDLKLRLSELSKKN